MACWEGRDICLEEEHTCVFVWVCRGVDLDHGRRQARSPGGRRLGAAPDAGGVSAIQAHRA